MDRKQEKLNELNNEILMLLSRELSGKNSKIISIKKENIEKVKRIEEFDKEDSLRAINKLVNAIDGSSFELKKVTFNQDYDVFYLYRKEDGFRIQLAYCKNSVDKIDYTCNFSKDCDNFSGVCAIDKKEYLYILDFMKYVMDYKLLKIDFNVCFEEFEQLVNIFVNKYMGECYKKMLVKKNN